MTADRYPSRERLAQKIEWEGGLEAFLDYGFSEDEVPEGDDELYDRAATMMVRWREYREAAGWFEELLPDTGE